MSIMGKVRIIVIVLFLGVIFVLNVGKEEKKVEELQQGIAEQVIRFHVLANSDEAQDQQLKLKVRDAVVEEMQGALKDIYTKEEAEQVIKDNLQTITEIAKDTLQEQGCSEPVTAYLTVNDFPVKKYGDTVFPAGKYETLQIEIGEAKGHNWWCVMYPSLCMVEEGMAVVPKESKEKLKEQLSQDEYACIDDKNVTVEYRLKIVELWKAMFK